MKIEFFTSKQRAVHLLESGLIVEIIREDADGTVGLSFDISTNVDALIFFHAGVKAGMESMSETVKKITS